MANCFVFCRRDSFAAEHNVTDEISPIEKPRLRIKIPPETIIMEVHDTKLYSCNLFVEKLKNNWMLIALLAVYQI